MKTNLGIFIYDHCVFSPDGLSFDEAIIDNETKRLIKIPTIHIYEYKAPLKWSVKNLDKNYYHQLNYAAMVLSKLLQWEYNFKYGIDYDI